MSCFAILNLPRSLVSLPAVMAWARPWDGRVNEFAALHGLWLKQCVQQHQDLARLYFIPGRSEVGQTLDAMAAYRSRSGW